MKQETLEEIAEQFIKKQNFNSLDFDDKIFEAILFSAKWQQKQIYNEIKELYDNENITGFSKLAYAKCLDIIKNK